MNIEITPTHLVGEVTVPPSKSVAHRMIIAAALADGESVISNVYPSKDILATINAMQALGAKISREGDRVTVRGIENPPEKAVIDCGESGSTLRFLIPVACALGVETTFVGHGRLPSRPITPYLDEFPRHGITFDYSGTMPFTVSGKLTSGEFAVSGSISSQFITGLLFALPLLDGDSRINLTSRLESRPYVDITRSCIELFGGNFGEDETSYTVSGGQKLHAVDCTVEGDYSQAAFFCVAKTLGSPIDIKGLNVNSFQGDKKIVEICKEIVYNKSSRNLSDSDSSDSSDIDLAPFSIDCSDIPDLVPILAVLASFCDGTSYITNAARLRIKECDRLAAISESLNACGGRVKETADGLEIEGVGNLSGGTVPDYNDHRIPMAMAVASTRSSKPITILGAQCVSKSYPDFWEVFRSLGGITREV